MPARDHGRAFPAAAELVEMLARTRVQQPDGTEVMEPGLYIEPMQLQVVCRRLWDEALAVGQAWAAANPARVTEAEREFLAASASLRAEEARRAEADRRQRRRERGFTIGMGVLGLLALIAVDGALWSHKQARQEANAAPAQVRLARAQTRLAVARSALPHQAVALLREQADDGTVPEGWDRTARELLAADVEIARWLAPGGGEIVGFEACANRTASAGSPPTPSCCSPGAEGHAVGFVATVARDAGETDPFSVRLWDAATGAVGPVLTGHRDFVRTVALSPDGGQVLTGSNDGTAMLWDAATGAAGPVLTGHESIVAAVSFSPDSRQVLTGANDATARRWHITFDALHDALWRDTQHCFDVFTRQDWLGGSLEDSLSVD